MAQLEEIMGPFEHILHLITFYCQKLYYRTFCVEL